jgi:hypothetical protein
MTNRKKNILLFVAAKRLKAFINNNNNNNMGEFLSKDIDRRFLSINYANLIDQYIPVILKNEKNKFYIN